MQYINLFCIPFAGGSKYSYRELEELAPAFLKFIPLEYPGRGARAKESLISDLDILTEDLYQQVKHSLDRSSYAIYGHSMGGLLGFLLTRKIIANCHLPPLHLFITGTKGPSALEKETKNRHLLEKSEFIEEIKKLDGLPEEMLANDELLDYFEPILRADFKATETYKYEEDHPLNIPITVITGTEEDATPEEVALWQKETICSVDIKRMKGTHFFIFRSPGTIISIMSNKILYNSNCTSHD